MSCVCLLVAGQTAAAPRLLLHYDFENDTDTQIFDSTGQFHGVSSGMLHVPGRVGKYGIQRPAYTSSSVRVPAAGTDLELAGTPYTIAFWSLSDPLVTTYDWSTLSPTSRTLSKNGELHAQLAPWPEVILSLGPFTPGLGNPATRSSDSTCDSSAVS